MQQLNMLEQLRSRADTATRLEQENRELRARLEHLDQLGVTPMYSLLRHICDTAPHIAPDGECVWDREYGRTPELFDAAVLNALIYIDPREEDNPRPAGPGVMSLDRLKMNMTARCRGVADAARTPEKLHARAMEALKAIQEWDQQRVIRLRDSREGMYAAA